MKAEGIEKDPESLFQSQRAPFIGALKKLVESGKYKVIIEVGTGNGHFIQYLESLLPTLDQFVGIDINPEKIKENTLRCADKKKIKFIFGEVSEYLAPENLNDAIFISWGVLECFTEPEVSLYFKEIGKIQNVAVVLNEPIFRDDARKIGHSIPTKTMTYSFDYPRLL